MEQEKRYLNYESLPEKDKKKVAKTINLREYGRFLAYTQDERNSFGGEEILNKAFAMGYEKGNLVLDNDNGVKKKIKNFYKAGNTIRAVFEEGGDDDLNNLKKI